MGHYSRQEAEEILKRALSREREEGISHDDLVAAASEVGIESADLEAAADELADERAELARRRAVTGELRRRLGSAAGSFLTANAIALIVDLMTGPDWWFHWVTLGTGIWLAGRAFRSFFPRDKDLRRAERRLLRRTRRQQRRHRAKARAAERRSPRKGAEAQFERAVEEGVEALLRTAADRIEQWNRQQRQEQGRPRVRVESDQADNNTAQQASRESERSATSPSRERPK